MRQLKLTNSDGIYAAWYDQEAEQVTVQYARGLAKYKYSHFTLAQATEMEAQISHVGRWFRNLAVVHPETYPVEKLD